MELHINGHRVIPRDRRYLSEVKEPSTTVVSLEFFMMLCVLMLQHLADPHKYLDATALFERLRFRTSPQNINRLFKNNNKYEDVLFEIARPLAYRLSLRISPYLRPTADELKRWVKDLLDRFGEPPLSEGLKSKVNFTKRLIIAGRFDEANKLLQTPWCSRIGIRTSRKTRDELLIKFHELRGILAMTLGDFDRADKEYENAFKHSEKLENPLLIANVAGNWGGLLRMFPQDGPKRACELWKNGLRIVDKEQLKLGTDYPRLRRWLNACLAVSLTIQGKDYEALSATAEALDYLEDCGEPFVGEIETRLRRSRILGRSGDLDRADIELEYVNKALQRQDTAEFTGKNSPVHWIKGWIPRYEGDVLLARSHLEKALIAYKKSWDLNTGYVFQQVLTAQRILQLANKIKNLSIINNLQLSGLSQLHRLLCDNISLSKCQNCKGETLFALRCIVSSRWKDVPPEFWG